MDSPYRPGFGACPAVLVGREQQLTHASASLTRVANSGTAAPSAMVLTGARGLGKTVTLGVIGDTATERGFITASVAFDSVSDNVQLLAGRVAEAIAPLGNRRAAEVWSRFWQRLASLSIEVNAGVVKIASPSSPRRSDDAQSTVQRQVLADLLASGAQIAAAHGRAGRRSSSTSCRRRLEPSSWSSPTPSRTHWHPATRRSRCSPPASPRHPSE